MKTKENIFFNAAHSPIGACASFTLGFPGMSGGLGIELGKPAEQNIYIGLENAHNSNFQAFPFYKITGDDLWSFEASAEARPKSLTILKKFKRDSIRRDFSAASDVWTAGDLTLKIISPILPIPNPASAAPDELKPVLLPAVYLQLTVDNRLCQKTRTAFIGYQGDRSRHGMRRFTLDPNLQGVAQGSETALIACQPDAQAVVGFVMPHILSMPIETRRQFGLGHTAALLVSVPPGEIRTFTFAACFYRAGIVTSGLDTSYYYTRLWNSLEAVARYAAENAPALIPFWETSDQFLAPLPPARKFMLAHALRNYYASTQLLESNGKPFWVVQEGEYRMMNTLDLTTDHVFYELRQNPWVVQNVLDTYIERYSYADTYGLSFTHDMGTTNIFAPAGMSAYELPNRAGLFSYMTHEQLVNWILIASLYALTCSADEWLFSRREIFTRCLESLLQRDHPDPAQRDGVMDFDSDLVGGGSEITTYDSLDSSLGQSRRNTYLAVKTWAAYLMLEQVFVSLNEPESAQTARSQSQKTVATLKAAVTPDGSLPAILDGKSAAKIIPTIEGLIFPALLGLPVLKDDSAPENLIPTLKRHLQTILQPGICLFPDGGWKLSSTSDNSWLSKIYLCQYVAESVLGFPPEQIQSADSIHADWLSNPQNAFWAWSDQIVAGKALASRFYPRGVTAILWTQQRS
jgi:hypothetical protein